MKRATLLIALSLLLPLTGSAAPTLPQGIYPLSGNSMDLSDADLAPLKAIVGNSSFVGLGETLHGSSGFIKTKARLIRFLVERLGFRAIGLETNRLDAEAATNYVATCQGSPDAALKSLRSFWRDGNDLGLLRWLCAFNKAHPTDKVFFFGFDIQEPYRQSAVIKHFVTQNLPSRGKADSLLEGIDHCLGTHATSWDDMVSSQEFADAYKNGIPTGDYRSCLSGIEKLQTFIHGLSPAPSKDAKLALLSLSGLRSNEQESYFATKDVPRSYELRDVGMLSTIQKLRQLYFPGQRVILSTHNVHIGRKINEDVGSPLTGARLMGVRLAQTFGDDFTPIALTGYQVQSHWANAPAEPIPSSPRSIEVMLHRLGHPYLLVDTRSPFIDPQAVYDMNEQGTGVKRRLTPNFRAIVYVDHSNANE